MKVRLPCFIVRSLIALAIIGQSAFALTINADFSRDITGANPGANPAPVLYAGTGPAPDAGTIWNDLRVPLAASGDSGANTVAHPVQFNNLSASNGTATTIGIRLTSGFTSSFNSTAAASTSVVSLQNDRVFPSLGSLATLTIQSLDPAKKYSVFLIGAASFSTAFTINSVSKIASGNRIVTVCIATLHIIAIHHSYGTGVGAWMAARICFIMVG